jgi:hypothetical protein
MSMGKGRFDQLTEVLLYMSETDAPLNYYELSSEKSRQWPPSTSGKFLSLVGEDPGTHVEEFAPEKFVEWLRQGNEDREAQVAALEKAMTGELRNLAPRHITGCQNQRLIRMANDLSKYKFFKAG